jgi:hypothetical protein
VLDPLMDPSTTKMVTVHWRKTASRTELSQHLQRLLAKLSESNVVTERDAIVGLRLDIIEVIEVCMYSCILPAPSSLGCVLSLLVMTLVMVLA